MLKNSRVRVQVQNNDPDYASTSAFPDEGFHLSMMHVDLGQGHTPAFCALAEPQTAPFHVCAGFKPPDEIGGECGWMVNFPFLRFRETSLPFHINGTRWHDSSCAGKNFRTERAGGINDECSNLNTAGYPSHQCIQRCECEACLGHTNISFCY